MKKWPFSTPVTALAAVASSLIILLAVVPSESDANLPLESESLALPAVSESQPAPLLPPTRIQQTSQATTETTETVQIEHKSTAPSDLKTAEDPLIKQVTQAVATAKETQAPEKEWIEKTVTIKRNDSLSTAMQRVGVGASVVFNISKTKNSKWLTHLRVGDRLTVWLNKDGDLERIVYPKTDILSYELARTDTGFHISKNEKEVEIRTCTGYATIEGAFYLAAERAGLSAKSIMQVADMFAWDIDFQRDLRDGDHLKVIYETRYLDGSYIGDGDIIAAQLTTTAGRENHNAFIMRDGEEVIGYYDEKGKNLKKTFLRAPVDTVRITSRFNPNRKHPVLGYTRAHKGVDYGGGVGTPIHTTGNGKIVYRGWKGGYGKVIDVQHTNGYLTRYAHMSRFGKYKQGQYVKQGQTIGYIGATGRVTGPHLHYEFHKHGVAVNPLKQKFPAAGPVAKKYREEFLQKSHFLLAQLKRLDQNTQLASNFE